MAAAAELAEVRRDVEALAAMERRSAGSGERASAEWVARRLREAGARDVALRPFRYQHTFAHAHAAHFAAGFVAAASGGVAGAALALAALHSFELEFSGRSQWLRRFLPGSEGVNVVARVPASGARRRTLVLVAHHDAAQTGLMWHPRVLGPAFRRAERTNDMGSFSTLPEAALGLTALGGLVGSRGARLLAAAVLATAVGLSADVARGQTVPGASDNATGVAAVLALVRRYASELLPDTEVVALLPGCEESGMGGMAAWLREERARLDAAATLVLGLDTLGAGEPIVLRAEGPVAVVSYRDEDIALAEAGAARADLEPPRRFRIGGWTDPVLAVHARLRAVSLLSIRGGGFTNYHLPTDTPERVDWDCVERCIRLAAGTVEEWVVGRRGDT